MFPKRIKFLLTLFAIFFAFALVYLPGFTKYQELKRKETEITNEIERLRGIALKLAEEERLLEGDPDYLERVARENLGRVRPGEMVYKIVTEDGKDPSREKMDGREVLRSTST